jgi:hypothetical protein
VIERLTYLCGIAVAVIGWAIGLLVADLTEVPVLYSTKSVKATDEGQMGSSVPASGGAVSPATICSDLAGMPKLAGTVGLAEKGAGSTKNKRQVTTLEFKNLSRKGRISNLAVTLLSREDCQLFIGIHGIEWTRADKLEDCDAKLNSLMPGSSLSISINHLESCSVDFRLTFGADSAVRTMGEGIESFLLLNWLNVIVGLLCAAALIFAAALVRAYQLSKVETSGSTHEPSPPPEAEVLPETEEIGAKQSDARALGRG